MLITIQTEDNHIIIFLPKNISWHSSVTLINKPTGEICTCSVPEFIEALEDTVKTKKEWEKNNGT